MKFHLIMAMVLLGLLACQTAFTEATNLDKQQSLLELIEEICSGCNDPSLPGGHAVAVIKDGRIIFKKAYGYSSQELMVPFTNSTVFDFASVAKQFAGMAIAMLVQEGKLSLDENIRTYFPEIPDYGQPITVRHLLHHTSGIRDWYGLVKISGHSLETKITGDFIYQLATSQEQLNFPPGEEFSYSNTNYFLLAQIVEKVTRKSFPKWMKENIFDPLHMDNTRFEENNGGIIPNLASSYARVNGEYHRSVSNLISNGSSSLYSTLDDMAKWMLNFEEGTVGGEQVFAMMRQTAVLNNGKESNYGFGLDIGSWRGLNYYGHGGQWSGYICSTYFFPEQRFGLIFMANRSYFPCIVDSRVTEAVLGHLVTNTVSKNNRQTKQRPGQTPKEPEKMHSKPLSDFELHPLAGVYSCDELKTEYRLEVRDGKLVCRHFYNEDVYLAQKSDNRFESDSWWFKSITIQRDPEGKVTGFLLDADGRQVRNLKFIRK